MTSAGAIRASQPASSPSLHSARWISPFESAVHARPQRCAWRATAARTASLFSARRSLSVIVPGVTMRTTLRSTGPFVAPTSPTCSQIATDSPSLTSRDRYVSTAWTGTPAIGIGSPALAPRAVSVMSSSRWPRLASS
jgi:hypothetical protein